ncbi:MAG: multicopper oxidase domain-containing protein [Daejeonella sp.]
MNKLLLLLLMLCFQQTLYAEHPEHSHSMFASMQTVYTCPMHPEVKSGKPGNCPKCGMKLVVQKAKATKPSAPATVKKAPAPKPSSQGAAASPAKKPAATQSAVVYTCPMHPEVKLNKPGNCPKCGMKLVVQKPAPTKRVAPAPVKKTPPAKTGNMDGMTMPAKKEPVPVQAKPVADPADTHQHENMAMPGKDSVETTEDMDPMKMAKSNLGPIKTIPNNTPPRTVRYDLYIADTIVNFTGKSKRAIAVNGQIPMPTLTFTQGDTAEIHVHNRLKENTSLHWHGLFLPNRYDGVPNLTQMPIEPGATHIYKFPIIQHGTHWYHSHSRLQEQIGMYGAFVMNKRAEWDIPTLPVTLSEWTDMNPKEVDRSLHAATDWFAIQKGATQSYSEAIKGGYFKIKVANEWKRMNAMDVSDVYYDRFLINGKNQSEQPQFKAGDKVRLRIANAGASTYFWLKYSGGKMTVVATDGNDVEPVEVDRLIIAVSETYDVVVTVPEDKSYEFLATSEDRTKSTSLWLGSGPKVPAEPMARLKYFAGMKMMNEMMDMQGNMVQMEGMKMQNQIMDMNTVMYPEITGPEKAEEEVVSDSVPEMKMDEKAMPMDHSGHNMAGMESASTDIVTLNYNMLRDPKKTTLPAGPMRELRFDLTGNMNRYVWTLDNKTVSESDKILIKKGENLRIILFNNSMMRHPMHLHGHDFRVLNEQGDNAPMKNVLDIMPMELDTIEFAASEAGGDWFFHCHILYHMMSGMGRIFSYENSPPNPEIPDPKLAQRQLFQDDRMFHPMGQIGLESNGSDGEFMLANTRYRLSTEWRIGLNQEHGNEVETYFGRYIGRMQWWFPFVGFDYHRNTMGNMPEKNMLGQISNQDNRKAFVAGVQYNLPMQVIAEARLDSKGKMRFQLMREDFPLTPRIRLNMMGNTDREYMGGLRYIVTKYISLSTHYDSDMGYGGGITLTY